MVMGEAVPEIATCKYCWLLPGGSLIEGVQATLMRWAAACSLAIGDGFDACKAVLELRRTEHPHHTFILRVLQDSCHLTSESVLILLGNCKAWDADCLVRSVVEGTVKFSNLCIGTDEEIEEKLAEYDGALFEISQLKKHKRLSAFLEAVDDPSAVEWRPFHEILLSPEELADLSQRYPKPVRRAIEDRWSFGKLIETLSRCGLPGFDRIHFLFYNYGTSSHILHQDADGVQMVWERNQRDPVRRDAVELAHSARIFSDLLMMSNLRHLMALRLTGRAISEARGLDAKYERFQRELHDCQLEWNAIEYRSETAESEGNQG